MHKSLLKFESYVENKLIRKVISPCGRLVLFNYTDSCTYQKAWDEITLNARGTVYEIETGKVVSKSFPKFFNFSELETLKQKELMSKRNFTVHEKADGSLGIVYFYDRKWRVNTRGSFTSDQAIKAKELLNNYDMSLVPKNVTLLVEIIYPENRIIVDYGNEEKLVLLAAYMDCVEIDLNLIEGLKDCGFEFANQYHDFRSIYEVTQEQARLGKMEEGFVVRFADGERVKFKSAEYLKIARIISTMTPLSFWRAMEGGKVREDLLEEIPEEFRKDSDYIRDELELNYNLVLKEIESDFKYCVKSIGGLVCLEEDRKNLGLFLKDHSSEIKHSGAMFAYLLDTGLDKYIINYIRPIGNEL